ncbi:MAG TPA: RdgB/HAM1 family non-canonical purine NTP pyrophosphatase [Steroidobacteraceae bacterium]|jgi:XTP/dITP diphosphohydrolase
MPRNSTHAPRSRLIVATANPGKLAEFRALLAETPFDLTSLGELNLPSPEESGSSFLANATLKARHASALSGLAALADDSGLEVDALNGAPGVYSARYAGAQGDDAANNLKLVAALAGVPKDKRRARYRCVLVLVRAPSDPAPLIAEGVWEGEIIDSPRGSGGFGYDPYFYLPALKCTAAELSADTKNRLSHRGRALQALRERL